VNNLDSYTLGTTAPYPRVREYEDPLTTPVRRTVTLFVQPHLSNGILSDYHDIARIPCDCVNRNQSHKQYPN